MKERDEIKETERQKKHSENREEENRSVKSEK